MNFIAQVAKKMDLLFHRNRFRSELDEEMAFHREQAEKDLLASGMSRRKRPLRGRAPIRQCHPSA